MDYLKIPLDLSSSLDKNIKRCSEEESIAQHIMMLIVSHYGEVVGKDDYGSIIWELEFNQLIKISEWEEHVKDSIAQTINNYEKRIKNVAVKVVLSEIDDDFDKKYNTHIRRKALISVAAKTVFDEKQFNFSMIVYISPLSQ